MSLATGLVALGSTQLTALPIRLRNNSFTTVAASTGAVLPADVAYGFEMTIRNNGANSLSVYPPLGYKLDGGTTNAAVALGAAATMRYVFDGAGGWWRMG